MSRVLRAQEGALQGRRAKGRPSQRNVPGWRGWSGVVRLWLSGSIQAFAMVAAGASAPCPPFIAPMFEITVVDEDDSTPICDVRVVAVDGEYSMLLRPDACRYRDVGENRRGTYALEMAKDGYHSLRVDGVVVAPDATGCTVQTVRARYSLKAIR